MNRVTATNGGVQVPTARIAEQSISPFVHVEIVNDLDDGKSTLCTATETSLGDFRETSPARALGMIGDARAQLDQAERLIKEHEACDTLAAILAEHDAQMQEWSTAGLDPRLRANIDCFAMRAKDGSTLIVVPAGQDPLVRTAVVADLVNSLDEQEAQAQA